MSDALTLPAEARERAGKGAARVLRREGRVPAVIYGGKEEPTTIHISSVTLPEGSESAITDRDFTIATIVAPSALKSETGEAAEATDAGSTEATEQNADAAEGEAAGE